MIKRILGFGLILSACLLASCGQDDDCEPPINPPVKEVSPVVFNLEEVPYQMLSEYHFFDGNMVDFTPVIGVLPYDVITPLFSDYAKKARFIWMPDSVKATYNGDHSVLSFQDGTVLIKNFYYDNVQPLGDKRVIETRVMFMRNGMWEFAEYVWNVDQTDAILDMNGSNTQINYFNDDNVNTYVDYRIPSDAECFTCHKLNDYALPIGPKPQNINQDFAYADGVKNQLVKWVEMGYLDENYPTNIVTTVKWDDPTQLLEDRVRSYLDMNCAHCHRTGSHCDYREIRLAFEETLNPDNMGVCMVSGSFLSPELPFIINGGKEDKSEMYFRLESTDEDVRMPLLGRSVVHEEGLQLLVDYINSLDPC